MNSLVQSLTNLVMPSTPPAASSSLPAHRRRRRPRSPMSSFSSPPLPPSGFSSQNFMLGAGMVVLQPSTHKVLLVYDTKDKHWFLPRGRKDVGETIEEAAVREAYEETGYRVRPLPLYMPTHAPAPPSNPGARAQLNTEPLYTSLVSWPANSGNRRFPGEYLTFWYAGQIPFDAVRPPCHPFMTLLTHAQTHTPISSTAMPDEQFYTSHLLSYADALECLRPFSLEGTVLAYVWTVYCHTTSIMAEDAAEREESEQSRSTRSHESDSNGTGDEMRGGGNRSRIIDSRTRADNVSLYDP
ncbi:hypothetical protein H0H87_008872 [Tephrocybe sp. NHM501043]|nr:hypothetical protein H0H87_008872 [Tephrocybe sp. NHM501043]